MSSEKQIRANRKNARQSTGPKTQEGKRRSGKNAVKHGLDSRDIVLWDEDPLEFEELRASLEEVYPPVNALVRELVDHLAGLLWRLRRPPRLEAASFGTRTTLTLALEAADPEARKKVLKRWSEFQQARGDDHGETDSYKDLGVALWHETPETVHEFTGGDHSEESLAAMTRHETNLRNGIARTLAMLHALGAGPVEATRT